MGGRLAQAPSYFAFVICIGATGDGFRLFSSFFVDFFCFLKQLVMVISGSKQRVRQRVVGLDGDLATVAARENPEKVSIPEQAGQQLYRCTALALARRGIIQNRRSSCAPAFAGVTVNGFSRARESFAAKAAPTPGTENSVSFVGWTTRSLSTALVIWRRRFRDS